MGHRRVTHVTATHELELFRTQNLGYAAFLQASRKLSFVRCELSVSERVAFVFRDPQHEGEHLRMAYETGAECSATGFYASLKGFRRVMTEALHQNRRARYEYQPGRD
jgi:hypothetical protein